MKFTRIVFFPILWLGIGGCLSAAGVNHSWDELIRQAKQGRAMDVTLKDSSHFFGRLESVTEDSIVLKEKRSSHKVARSDVFRVRYKVSRGRRAIWGALILGMVGASAWAAGESWFKAEAAVFGAIFGGAVGAVTGAALPIGALLFEADISKQQHP